MSSVRRFSRTALAVIICLAVAGHPCLAATLAETVGACEKEIGAKTRSNATLAKRVESLEKAVFGSVQQGLMVDRVHNLRKHLFEQAKEKETAPILQPTPQASPDSEENMPASQPTPGGVGSSNSVGSPDIPTIQAEPITAEDLRKRDELIERARTLHSTGNNQSAMSCLEDAIDLDPASVHAHYYLGKIWESEGNFDKAKMHYKAALARSPGHPTILRALRALDDGPKDQGPKALPAETSSSAGTIDSEPATTPEPITTPAAPKRLSKNNQKPTSTTSTAVPQSQRSINEQFARRRAAIAKRFEQAKDDFQRGDYHLAIESLQEIVSEEPFDADVHYALGQALRGAGKNDEGLFHLRQACDLAPDNEKFRNTLARASAPVKEAPFSPSTTAGITPMQPEPTSVVQSGWQDEEQQPTRNYYTSSRTVPTVSYRYDISPQTVPYYYYMPRVPRATSGLVGGLAGAGIGMSVARNPGRGALWGGLVGGLLGLLGGGY